MLHTIISIIALLLTIFFVIGIHEGAHFLTARLFRIKVLRFSIGFGKTLFRRYDRSGTEYIIALIPLGGYVQMLDEKQGPVVPDERRFAFNCQPFYKKFLVVLAGPVANLVSAFILYWIIFVIGFVTVKPIIGQISPHSIASKAMLQSNYEITRINGEVTPTWTKIIFNLIAHIGDSHTQIELKNPITQVVSTHTLDLSTWRLDGLTPDPLLSLGITPYQPSIPLVIKAIKTDSPASHSKLKMNDILLAINGKAVDSWHTVFTMIAAHPNETLTFQIKREGKKIELPVLIGHKNSFMFKKTGYLGIGPHFELPALLLKRIQYSPLNAISVSAKEMFDFVYFNVMLFGKIVSGQLSLQSLGGPITIFESAGSALQSGLMTFASFLAFLSISIGVINLMPIPGLDGGHLFIQIIEAIIRRPLPDKLILFLYRIGFLLIFFLLIQALINDILRL